MINTFILSNIFDQFIPVKISIFSLTLIGSIIALSWIWLNTKTHWIVGRGNSPSLLLSSLWTLLMTNINNKTNPWAPWLFSLFLLCFSFNIMSLIPYTFSQTSHLSFTFSLSLPIWVMVNIAGFKNSWKNKVSHLLPQGTPIYLVPVMIIIETISLFIQPLTLGFRLGANLLAGHLLIFLCSCTIWEAINYNLYLGAISFSLIVILLILEIAVAFIQATVFLILSKNYLEENINN
uniref:ATP synthase subunit a n=1 Tax=Ophiura sarsii TaxID=861515 RepID=A0A5J6BS88_9ECHI|nr:ATP synthase F0 subunit 6 [Ophiura sarsii]QEP94702.1 ATP synthase F0 subunit 6 [Ophiura sarsii]QHT54199.1 ATP synthase F0 subunit 6 [Ophiura sarsii]QYF07885.1 ATP synthase F0 subunit 6 [Ophiura sarsii]